MGSDRRKTIIGLLSKVADSPGFDWDSYMEVNRLLANRLVDRDVGAALQQATELYLDSRRRRNLSAAEFYEATAERRERIREFLRHAGGQGKHGQQ